MGQPAKKPPRQSLKSLDEKIEKVAISTNECLDEIDTKIEEKHQVLEASMEEIKKMIHSIYNPAPRKMTESDEQEMNEGLKQAPEFNEDGEIIDVIDSDVNDLDFKERNDNEAFLNEKVDIHIHDSSEPNADEVFEVAVNGRKFIFERNREYKNIPRYVVFVLASAKPLHYDNVPYTKPDGVHAVKWPRRAKTRYPFAVVRDTPRGREWLKKVLADAR